MWGKFKWNCQVGSRHGGGGVGCCCGAPSTSRAACGPTRRSNTCGCRPVFGLHLLAALLGWRSGLSSPLYHPAAISCSAPQSALPGLLSSGLLQKTRAYYILVHTSQAHCLIAALRHTLHGTSRLIVEQIAANDIVFTQLVNSASCDVRVIGARHCLQPELQVYYPWCLVVNVFRHMHGIIGMQGIIQEHSYTRFQPGWVFGRVGQRSAPPM